VGRWVLKTWVVLVRRGKRGAFRIIYLMAEDQSEAAEVAFRYMEKKERLVSCREVEDEHQQ
jgi:hypothetical protein